MLRELNASKRVNASKREVVDFLFAFSHWLYKHIGAKDAII